MKIRECLQHRSWWRGSSGGGGEGVCGDLRTKNMYKNRRGQFIFQWPSATVVVLAGVAERSDAPLTCPSDSDHFLIVRGRGCWFLTLVLFPLPPPVPVVDQVRSSPHSYIHINVVHSSTLNSRSIPPLKRWSINILFLQHTKIGQKFGNFGTKCSCKFVVGNGTSEQEISRQILYAQKRSKRNSMWKDKKGS